MDTIRVTNVELGVPNSRKHIGHFYVSRNANSKAHATKQCPDESQHGYNRLPVYEEDGKTYWFDYHSGERAVIPVCDLCKDMELDYSWAEDGACYQTEDLRFVDGDESVIEEYCRHCPVILKCFDTAAEIHKENIGTVWGGMYFPKNKGDRLAKMEQHRKVIQTWMTAT